MNVLKNFKKLIVLPILFLTLVISTRAQQVNGLIYADTAGVMVVKIWGTHQERGYALGYLTGDRITDVIVNYIKPSFGPYYTMARNTVLQGNDLAIPPEMDTEAQAIIDGMNAAGANTGNLDKTDVLVGNTYLDISNLMMLTLGMNCAALMSWNDATAGTDLNGAAIVTRHLDWEISPVLNRNHAVIVHFPSEPGESKWIITGFSCLMGALSGITPDFAVFQNMMDDNSAAALHNQHYQPIWFTLRKAVESTDYNNDGHRDVLDVRAALLDCTNGFSDGFIISALAKSNPVDSLVAMVAEITPLAPTQTFRSNSYPDSIPGDNLYTANYQIARNNQMHFCPRYNGIRSHIGNGTMIGRDTSWNLMRDWSHFSHNLQMMQFAPEADLFRISVYRDGLPAYMNEPVAFTLTELFNEPVTGTGSMTGEPKAICRYDRSLNGIEIRHSEPIRKVGVFDFTGRLIYSSVFEDATRVVIPVANIRTGIYMVRVASNSVECVFKVMLDH